MSGARAKMRAGAGARLPRFGKAGWQREAGSVHRARRCARRAAGSAEPTTEVDVSSPRELGKSGVEVAPVGIGAWSWGDGLYWNPGGWDADKERQARDVFDAYVQQAGEGAWFDTAEVYGGLAGGKSEEILGGFIRDEQGAGRPLLATKFAALPWRLTQGSVVDACRASLARMRVEKTELYQLHWPGLWNNEAYLDGLAQACEEGVTQAVGVSNYSEKRLRAAHARLADKGVPLAANQVHYNLLYRMPELNGVLEACKELGVTLIAYSPLAQGILSGKYDERNLPAGPRGRIYDEGYFLQAKPVLDLMRAIGENHGGKTPTQVALNWLLVNPDVVVIPGAKNRAQLEEIMGCLDWRLEPGEVDELRKAASKVSPVRGFPAEDF